MEQPKPTSDEASDPGPDFTYPEGAAENWSPRYGGAPPPPPPRGGLDFSSLFVLLDMLRRAAPDELGDRFSALTREALLTLRSLIDWYLERLDNPPPQPRVEDIPIE